MLRTGEVCQNPFSLRERAIQVHVDTLHTALCFGDFVFEKDSSMSVSSAGGALLKRLPVAAS